MKRLSTRVVISLATLGLLTTSALPADWLVTRAGERIETEGGWTVEDRRVIFTQPSGTLASLRLAEVDLDASAAATAEAAEAAAAPAAPPREPGPGQRSRRVITTDDVGEGIPGAEGGYSLVESLRLAHRYKDVGLAMGLVNWQDVPDGMRNYIETQFEWMMERRIRNIRFIEIEPEEAELQAVQEDSLYEPNVDVAGRIEIDFFPDPDQEEVSLKFQVGTRLGVFFIAAPREVEE